MRRKDYLTVQEIEELEELEAGSLGFIDSAVDMSVDERRFILAYLAA